MSRKETILVIILTFFFTSVSAQVRIRLFSNQPSGSAVFSVTSGRYELIAFNGGNLNVDRSESVFITRFNGKLAVKTKNEKGFICDSLILHGKTGTDTFSLRTNGYKPVRKYYSDDLRCYPDLGTILLINECDVENYISGVVKAEGGTGKNTEYFKTQAIIARTYMYRYFDRHLADRYNLCDDTHCQSFNGLSLDTLINKATQETKGMVIIGKDSTLIMAAFHSNCGGETNASENVWLTSQPYLISVADPYCLSSYNARWEKKLSMSDWLGFLRKSGYEGKTGDPAAFIFNQQSRLTNYRTGSFTIPLSAIRSELNLRSTFFSVSAYGDSLILKGRGYGHGVGLCQEGAMVMAEKGFNFSHIIDFYYVGVSIANIKKAVHLTAKPIFGSR